MASPLWIYTQPTRREPVVLARKKREKSGAALIFAVLIGACAALGIVLLANGGTRELASSGAAAGQADSQR